MQKPLQEIIDHSNESFQKKERFFIYIIESRK